MENAPLQFFESHISENHNLKSSRSSTTDILTVADWLEEKYEMCFTFNYEGTALYPNGKEPIRFTLGDHRNSAIVKAIEIILNSKI